jgi:hypothetical protein
MPTIYKAWVETPAPGYSLHQRSWSTPAESPEDTKHLRPPTPQWQQIEGALPPQRPANERSNGHGKIDTVAEQSGNGTTLPQPSHFRSPINNIPNGTSKSRQKQELPRLSFKEAEAWRERRRKNHGGTHEPFPHEELLNKLNHRDRDFVRTLTRFLLCFANTL